MSTSIEKRLVSIERFMENGVELRVQNAATLARIETNMLAFNTYQAKCDDERSDLDDRTKSLENSRSKQAGFAAAISAVCSTSMFALLEYIKK